MGVGVLGFWAWGFRAWRFLVFLSWASSSLCCVAEEPGTDSRLSRHAGERLRGSGLGLMASAPSTSRIPCRAPKGPRIEPLKGPLQSH